MLVFIDIKVKDNQNNKISKTKYKISLGKNSQEKAQLFCAVFPDVQIGDISGEAALQRIFIRLQSQVQIFLS
jgi:hypothetical protein